MVYPVSRELTRVSGWFGPRKPILLPSGQWSPSFHGGVDFTPTVKGARLPAYSVGDGTVLIADKTVEKGDTSGLDVGIRIGDGSIWWYGHLSQVDVYVGQRVKAGQRIGLLGTTGNSTGVHLHLERHWPSLNVETDPWPHIADDPDPSGKAADKSASPVTPTPPEEDDMALTEQQAAALDWLGAEDRRKTFDERLWQIGQLAARIGVIDRLGNSAGATEIADAVAEKLALPGITAETVQAIAEAVADEQASRLRE